MKNRISKLIEELNITAYQFAKETGITLNTIYLLRNNPDQFPSGNVFSRIIKRYKLSPNDIVECADEAESA
jgi:predicted transcriptional regulator